jgi:hypothetical protein
VFENFSWDDPALGGDLDNQVALPIHFRRGTINLRYFMTITTLGTPLDVTAQELRIESYFPMDAETEAFEVRPAGEADGVAEDRAIERLG